MFITLFCYMKFKIHSKKIKLYKNGGEVNIPDMTKSSKHSEKSSESISNSPFSDKVTKYQ